MLYFISYELVLTISTCYVQPYSKHFTYINSFYPLNSPVRCCSIIISPLFNLFAQGHMEPRFTPGNLVLEPTVFTTTSPCSSFSLCERVDSIGNALVENKWQHLLRKRRELSSCCQGLQGAGDHALLAQEGTSEYVSGQEQPEIRLASQPRTRSFQGDPNIILKGCSKNRSYSVLALDVANCSFSDFFSF